MMRSLYSAVAGLKNHQTKMDVIGNNISNVNTVAFKASSVTFSDIIYQTLSGASGPNQTLGGVNAKQIGLGMSTAATSMKITNAGSAQTTGKPFDLRINDSGSSTNFFVVNNGTKNVYTRDGCFYIDGAGTLCMDSTGYKLMGWLADPNTGEVITSGDVTALSIMDTPNLTSAPEATENAYASGIIDKDTPDLSSTQGYTMALEFYDDLGYPYSARFTVHLNSDDGSVYSVKLSQILDQNGVDVLKEITEAQGITLDKIFGKASTSTYSMDAGTPYVTNSGLNDLLNGTTWKYDTNDSANYAGGVIGHLRNTDTGESIYFNANGAFYQDPTGNVPYTGSTQSWGTIFTRPDGSSTLTHPWSDLDQNTINITETGKVSLVQIEGANTNNILKENWYFLDTVYDMIVTTVYDVISSASVGTELTSKIATVSGYPFVDSSDVTFAPIEGVPKYTEVPSVDVILDGTTRYYKDDTGATEVTPLEIVTGALPVLGTTPGTVYDEDGTSYSVGNEAALLVAINAGKKIYPDNTPTAGTEISTAAIVDTYKTEESVAKLYKQDGAKWSSKVTYYLDESGSSYVKGDDIIAGALSGYGGTVYNSNGDPITKVEEWAGYLKYSYPIYDSADPNTRNEITTTDLVNKYKAQSGNDDLFMKGNIKTSTAVYYLDDAGAASVPGDDIIKSALTTLGATPGTLYDENGKEVKTAEGVLTVLAAGKKLYAEDPTINPDATEITSANIVDEYKNNEGVAKLYEKTTTRVPRKDPEGNPIPASDGWPVKYGDYEYPNPAEKNPADTWAGYFVNINTNRMLAVTVSGALYEYDKATDTYIASSLALDSVLKDFDADTSKVEITGRDIAATYTNYDLTFSKADGSFQGIDDQDSVYMFASALGPNFHNVSIDFTALRNANNGKKSTAGMDSGTSATNTTGAGKKLGSLVGVAVQNDGRIYGSYDNGNTVLLGQIASAHFANASGLEKIGESCYNTTLNSGDAVIGDISADGSSMTSGEIEMSNVDLSAEFTDMITTQRGFQANSRVITTSDTLLEELINLKR